MPFNIVNNLKLFTAEFCLFHALDDLEAAIKAPHTPAGQTVDFKEQPGEPEYFLALVGPWILWTIRKGTLSKVLAYLCL
jgi:hypothetical protein